MGRRRKKNLDLPKRVYVHHGSYRYEPKTGPKITLARVGDFGGMLRALANYQPNADRELKTLTDVMNRYQREILPTKAATSQPDQRRMISNLRRSFGQMNPNDLRQHHAARYLDKRAAGTPTMKAAPTAANREIELLSHICTKAVRWGAMEAHPLKGFEKIPRPPRQRYVTDAEYAHIHGLASPMVRCVLDLALLTGLRRGDIFCLERRHMSDAGIEIRTSKTGAALLFEWTPALERVVKDALVIAPEVRQYIVCNRKGKQYTKNGFDSVWARLMAKATDPSKDGSIERFEFRDLRRKSASDEADELVAQQRLGHTSVAITNRVYRVKPKHVKPLR